MILWLRDSYDGITVVRMKDTKMPTARITVSIDKAALDRFFRAYPAGRRSQVIQRLIEQDLDGRLAQLTRAAEQVETHPDFQTVRDDCALWERATAPDGLDTI